MKTYVFPGQGSQRKGMGGSLFDEFPELTAKAHEVLGYSVEQLCLEDPRGELDQTAFTQPALYVVNALSYHRKLKEGGQPDFLAGHSLGEFNALLAAGCYSFETGLELVKKRGELMGRASGGGMAAVLNAPEEQIRAILAANGITSIDLANYNTRAQLVLSGPLSDIKAAQPLFETGKHLFMPLKTSAAFHSRYMEPARAEFAEFLTSYTFDAPKVPVISNVTARPYEADRIAEYLAKQIVSAVRWTDTVEYLLGHEGMEFEELGHGNVLTKLVQKIRRERPADAPAPTPAPVAAPAPTDRDLSAADLVTWWNDNHPVGTRVKSTTGAYELLETATPAIVLFGHRAAVYMNGYRGYFDLNEIELVG